ncbi:putative leucine-rich repeat receptor-like serine/threonine-protein kinase-like isoform X1 [Capsicum annuum]|nr:putative leucine-rich repeat receptor-like serine/threonine-protein kinase-like isoform X1 [Capsicum annuum]
MVSGSFNILLLVLFALMVVASAGGTRKLLVKQEYMVDDISGDARFNSMKTSHMNAQVDSQMFKKNERNFLNMNQFPEQNHKRSKKEESKEFVDVENGVPKLISTDDHGHKPPIHNLKPTDYDRSKPPIHNHKPTDYDRSKPPIHNYKPTDYDRNSPINNYKPKDYERKPPIKNHKLTD